MRVRLADNASISFHYSRVICCLDALLLLLVLYPDRSLTCESVLFDSDLTRIPALRVGDAIFIPVSIPCIVSPSLLAIYHHRVPVMRYNFY